MKLHQLLPKTIAYFRKEGAFFHWTIADEIFKERSLGVFLQYMSWWAGKKNTLVIDDKPGWIYKTVPELSYILKLHPRKVQRIKKRLKAGGILEEIEDPRSRLCFYRINWALLDDILYAYYFKETPTQPPETEEIAVEVDTQSLENRRNGKHVILPQNDNSPQLPEEPPNDNPNSEPLNNPEPEPTESDEDIVKKVDRTLELIDNIWADVSKNIESPADNIVHIGEAYYNFIKKELTKLKEQKLTQTDPEPNEETPPTAPVENQPQDPTQTEKPASTDTPQSDDIEIPDLYELYRQLYPQRLVIPSLDAGYLKMIKDIIDTGKLDKETILSLLSFWTAKQVPLKSLYDLFKKQADKVVTTPDALKKPERSILVRRSDPLWRFIKSKLNLDDDDVVFLIVNDRPWDPSKWMTELDFKVYNRLSQTYKRDIDINSSLGRVVVYKKQRESVETIFRFKI